MPAAGKAASQAYQEESDVIGRFFDECCVLGNEHETQVSKLYDSFREWCGRNGEGGYAANKFGQLVGKRNQFEKKRKKMNNKCFGGNYKCCSVCRKNQRTKMEKRRKKEKKGDKKETTGETYCNK